MEQKEVFDRIVQWYLSDTIKFVDLVLSDAEDDPQYSVVTLCNRIKIYTRYIELTTGKALTVSDFLTESGYIQSDIDFIEEKRAIESKYYCGEQL